MPSLSFEKQHGFADGRVVCGVDEAGRGPLAGPVMAAAVVLPPKMPRAISREIRDSKKMTAQQREDLFEPLTQLCRYAVAEASVAEISKFNILWASMLAMQRAVEGLEQLYSSPLEGEVRWGVGSARTELSISRENPPSNSPLKGGRITSRQPCENSQAFKIDVALIDGNRCPQLKCHAVAIVEGDDKSLSIAAASIIAKVTRDRFMRKLAQEHPGYGWERNAGYGTREHIAALRRLGATAWHRPSFAPVMQLELEISVEERDAVSGS